MSIKVLQLHKRASYKFNYIQDKYAINSTNDKIALADGTTQSFNSEIWAEIISTKFVNNPTFIPNELITLFTNSISEFKNTRFEYSENPAKASLEKAKLNKGGTATFIGLQICMNNKLEIIACGDTNFFKINGSDFTAFPFTNVNDLDNNNHFINTEQLLQNKIDDSYFKNTTLEYKSGDIIIIATDALSRLILNNNDVINELIFITDFESLQTFCMKYWESKELQEDDISALIISFNNDNSVTKILPYLGFSFPKEIENDFIPTSILNETTSTFNDMQMQEIRNQFNGVANDFQQVKNKLKLHEMLLMIAISLLVINLFFIFYFSPREIKLPFSSIKENTVENNRNKLEGDSNNVSEKQRINSTKKMNEKKTQKNSNEK